MKTENIVYIVLIVIISGAIIFSFVGMNGEKTKQTSSGTVTTAAVNTDSTALKSIETGSTNTGDVMVELTPHTVSNGLLTVDFKSNTHSVDLSNVNLKEAVTLSYAGKEIKPIKAPTLSGHHNSGVLEFEVSEELDSFSISITGIPKIEERVFTW